MGVVSSDDVDAFIAFGDKAYPFDFIHLLKGHLRYLLKLAPWSEGAPVYVKALLNPEIPEYKFDNDEDSRFNLSSMIGEKDGSLVWGGSGFEATAKSIEITTVTMPDIYKHYEIGDRLLRVEFEGAEKERPAELVLDRYLDVVKYPGHENYQMRTPPKFKLQEKKLLGNRSVVLCFDGTSNHFSNQNTNVVKLVELLKKDDPMQQLVYYQTGVGTYAPPGLLTKAGLTIAAKADEGVAWFLYQHVIDGYKYLMQTYQEGDEISIFGFSRGAYTARALAGMIHAVGLLPKHNMENVPFAYQVYEASANKFKAGHSRNTPRSDSTPETVSNTNEHNSGSLPEHVDPKDFKRTFCIPIKINFVGVWDTVGSVGAFTRKVLPFIEHNPSIRFFRQALALDENRGNFIPSVWDHSLTDLNYQDAVEVWFKGGHADVGGGAPPPDNCANNKPSNDPRLSNIPLRWMIQQCFELNTNLIFDTEALQRYRDAKILDNRWLHATWEEQQVHMDELDAFDIAVKPYIALHESPSWKILEYLPVPKLDQLGKKRSYPDTVRWPNACAPRTINTRSGDPIFLHTSVFLFLQTKAEKEGYVPAAIWHSSEKGVSPYIGDGVQLHRIGKTDCDREVRKRLKVSWDTPEEQEIWWNPSTWTWGSIIVPVDTLDNLKDVMRAAGAIRRAMYI